MADKTKFRNDSSVYWTNIARTLSDEDGEADAYVPGLSSAGNMRPDRIKPQKPTKSLHSNKPPFSPPGIPHSKHVVLKPALKITTTESEAFLRKAERGRSQGSAENNNSRKGRSRKPGLETSRGKTDKITTWDDDTMSSAYESFKERNMEKLQQVSLKDLRPEDKQRVANLIKELARVSDEKETVVKELHGEREHHEKQLVTMVTQQEKILQEREDIQDKLFQCQKLLTEYQSQLLDRQEQLNSSINEIRDVPDREPVHDHAHHRGPANQNHYYNVRTNHEQQEDFDESASDLLMNNIDPNERIKRPFTSLIDKEIAKERSRSQSRERSRGTRSRSHTGSRSRSPGGGRPKFAYPERLGTGPLQEPLASSTHKSMEIKAQMSSCVTADQDDLDSPRSFIREGQGSARENNNRNGQLSSKLRDSSDDLENCDNFNAKQNSKVAFNDARHVYNTENCVKHSPTNNVRASSSSSSQLFNDPAYADYYKKLSPGGRKRELLKQRQALLNEQERLRHVLDKQERQLKQRQYEYNKREELQKERMEFYRQGGKFPALRLDFDGEAENPDDGLVGPDDDEDMNGADGEDDVQVYKDGQNVEVDEAFQVRSRVSMGTSPISSPGRGVGSNVVTVSSPARVNKVTIATSPAQSDGPDAPRMIDVATSISYRLPSDTSSRQGNLPLAVNRQKSSPSQKRSSRVETAAVNTRKPGEKTLNVLELVNSMEEEDPGLNMAHVYDEMENRRTCLTPQKANIINTDNQSRGYRQYTSPSGKTRQGVRNSHGKMLNDSQESVEESRILEDIFFL